jgi:diaminopimelate decarboxylase
MGDLAIALARKYFGISNGELLIGGTSVNTFAETYGTPAFIYDRGILDQKLDALRQALPARFSVCYSMKANPNQTILRHFLSRGCGLEIASAGEFHQGLQAACNPQNMLFAGPGKTPAELELALSHGIGEIHLESLVETARVSAISKRLGIRARVAIRVNPASEAEGGAMRMGGRPAPFGVDEETVAEVVDTVIGDAALELRGIHLYIGTQILDANVIVSQYSHGLQVAKQVANRIGHPLHRVDFGGGLGIPYFAHEQLLNLDELRARLATLFAGIETDDSFSGTEFLVEPGRFLVGEAGIYLARIIDIKVSRGKKFLIVDGGMNHHLAASGNLGQTIKRNYPVAILNKMVDAALEDSVDVVGPLCTPLDTLARNVTLPRAEIGDFFGIFQSGAYARAASPLGFLSHPSPPEVWVDSGEHSLVRKRGDASEAMLGTIVPRGVTKN